MDNAEQPLTATHAIIDLIILDTVIRFLADKHIYSEVSVMIRALENSPQIVLADEKNREQSNGPHVTS